MTTLVAVPSRKGTWPSAGAAQLTSARRLNVGCGQWPLRGWTNIDADPSMPADVFATVPPLPYPDASLDEIYAGHVLEHLTPEDATGLLVECRRCLAPGGRLGVVVPDTRAIMTRWLAGTDDLVEYPPGQYRPVRDLDEVCALFLYSTLQPSHHQWSYDLGTLRRKLASAGFIVGDEIDRETDPRIPVGAWYQCGLDAMRSA